MPSTYDYPEEGELVVCSVSNVKSFGAFVTLDEYDDKEGFIHVAEIATGWVKYIRDHIREGQKVVCKVLNVEKKKGHIDLSLKQVNEHQKRDKIQLWKNEQKADKLLSLLAEELGKDLDEVFSDFGTDLVEKYGSLYAAFEKGSMGAKRLAKDGIEGDWVETFVEVSKANIAPPQVNVTGIFELSHTAGNGIEIIKESILEALDAIKDNEYVSINYLGAPRYRVEVTAEDYKEAEKMLHEAVEAVLNALRENGGTAKFVRDE